MAGAADTLKIATPNGTTSRTRIYCKQLKFSCNTMRTANNSNQISRTAKTEKIESG
jgi:hypothetical protein